MIDIAGYEKKYAITEKGDIWSYQANRFIKSKENPNGYYYVTLWKDNKRKGFRVHRLVAEAYIPNPNNYPCVNHKDENKLNNYASNLEWCTHEYNNNYGTRIQRQREAVKGKKQSEITRKKRSEALKGRVLSEEHKQRIGDAKSKPVRCIETGEVFKSVRHAQKITNVRHISCCCTGKRKTAGGYHWEYIFEKEEL